MKKLAWVLALCLITVMALGSVALAAPVEVDYWSVFTGADGATMQGMVDAFNASQDEVKVNHTPMTADDLYQKIPLAVQSGSGIPDVTIVHIERIPAFVSQDLIWPIDTLLENGILRENYIPSAWERTDIDGEHYGVPLDVHSYVTYYNKTLFEKYDLNAYVEDGYLTFDEVKELADKAKAAGYTDKVMGLDWFRAQMLSYYAQLGEGKLTEDGETPSFNNDEMARVYETLKDLHDNGYTTVKGDDPMQLFYAGNLLIWPEGIWMKAGALDAGVDIGMLPSLCYTPETCKNWTSSHNFVQFADDDRTEEEDIAVAKFINYMGENSLVWARDGGQVPAHVSINDVPEFKDMMQAFLADPERGDELAIYYYKYWGLFDTAFSRNGFEPVFGTMSAEDALKAAEQEVIDAIAAQ
ncbi:MAG: extracellular solute-binding protein [Oscillospiraceae bacterium]|jgi:multiple sugar transport system substrate-binding protein|nr:extracellular solute-binding protein [Oscillospiraceae bacterium]